MINKKNLNKKKEFGSNFFRKPSPKRPFKNFPNIDENGNEIDNSLRLDGTPKAQGYFGELPMPDGRVATEISIGGPWTDENGIQHEEPFMPSIVPTLTKKELDFLLQPSTLGLGGKQMPKSITDKAKAYYKERITKGLSPFAQPGEFVFPVPIDEGEDKAKVKPAVDMKR